MTRNLECHALFVFTPFAQCIYERMATSQEVFNLLNTTYPKSKNTDMKYNVVQAFNFWLSPSLLTMK